MLTRDPMPTSRPASPPARQPASHPARRDLLITALALLALLAWDLSGWDLALIRLYGDAQGFALRNAWITRNLLHDGGRWLSAAMLALLVWDVWRPILPGRTLKHRLFGLGVVLLNLLVVPLIKRFTSTSCPWDLAEFGGIAAYVPHWQLGVSGGGGGHCFPSGHAVAAFAFFGAYFSWRQHHPRLARATLVGVLVVGSLFAWAQMARGAHFASHSLWTAWLCWTVAMAAYLVQPSARTTPALQRAAGPA